MDKIEEKRKEIVLLLSGEEEFLTEREKQLILLRFFSTNTIPTYEEIGKRFFSVGKERVRQLLTRASRKLRHPSRKKYLSLFYDYIALLPEGERKRALENWLIGRKYDLKLEVSPISKEIETKLQEHWEKGFFRKNKPVYFIVPEEEQSWNLGDVSFVEQLIQEGIINELHVVNRIEAIARQKIKERTYEIECDTQEEAKELVQKIKKQLDHYINSDVTLQIKEHTVFLNGRFGAGFHLYVKKYYMQKTK